MSTNEVNEHVLAAGNKSGQVFTLLTEAAARWPERPAVTYQGVTQTWHETLLRCRAQASVFAQAGIERGDRVAYLGFNSNVCSRAISHRLRLARFLSRLISVSLLASSSNVLMIAPHDC